jgi:hypothetical protein
VPQQATLQATRLGTPEAQVVLEEVRLSGSREAGVKCLNERVKGSDVLGSQIGGTRQDGTNGRVELLEGGQQVEAHAVTRKGA